MIGICANEKSRWKIMWIRSQNNEYLINTTYFEIEEYANSPKVDIDARVEGKWIILGQYSTKGKALKVLDDIENTLYCLNGFYHMPKDDEVEDDE